jgi:hypothetical protein
MTALDTALPSAVPRPDDATPTTPRRVREVDVELPVGLLDADGRLHRRVTLRKMTGHEEALLADRKLRANGGRLVTELLVSCVRRLGETDTVTRQVVGSLTSPDRNYLLLELRKLTFGSELDAGYTCPACRATTTVVEDLDGLEVRRSEVGGGADLLVDLADGFEDRGTGTWYSSLRFRLPTGIDEERVAAGARDNPARATNALLARCLVDVVSDDGEPMPEPRREALGTRMLQDLTMGDRGRIEQAFREQMPGADLTREIECEACGRPIRASLDLTGFFTPS